jgi:hypothetical protein
MRAFNVMAIVAAGIVLSAGQAFAQTVVAPTAGCTATPAQLEANKKVAMAARKPGSATTNTSSRDSVARGSAVREGARGEARRQPQRPLVLSRRPGIPSRS